MSIIKQRGDKNYVDIALTMNCQILIKREMQDSLYNKTHWAAEWAWIFVQRPPPLSLTDLHTFFHGYEVTVTEVQTHGRERKRSR